ncbi:(2Fe-2S)-binding protein [Fodinicurvata sp. EGI_FJ10296]|uniref:(2Fe-2S)-binding protein n=1 Tax=Fodinicurvata sp. EGI_FJ10296 TaxID=3231908 RepID=UPI003453F83F
MFKRHYSDPDVPTVTIRFEGEAIEARATDTVAAALLIAGVTATRTTPVTGQPRAPYCMMGVCFDCLMVIDGEGDRQACLVPVAEGMTVSRQNRTIEVVR